MTSRSETFSLDDDSSDNEPLNRNIVVLETSSESETEPEPEMVRPRTKPGGNITGRRWCFTLNNWTDDELDAAVDWLEDNTRYAVVGKEVGRNNTPHLQGYFRTSKNMRYHSLGLGGIWGPP